MSTSGRTRQVSALGRVTDPRALDASTGPCGRVRVVIPEGWAREGAAIEVVVPSKVECGVCRGGGCDRCNRSGAHRLTGADTERTLELSLPPLEGDAVLLRVPQPFGASAELELLNVEVTKGETASSCCRLMRKDAALVPAGTETQASTTLRWLWLVALIAVLLVAALISRS
jgi:hypothetical protein